MYLSMCVLYVSKYVCMYVCMYELSSYTYMQYASIDMLVCMYVRTVCMFERVNE